METVSQKQELLDKRYLRMADIWAENSYCVRRKVGAILVKDQMIISDGYNGTCSAAYTYAINLNQRILPRSVEQWMPKKYSLFRYIL